MARRTPATVVCGSEDGIVVWMNGEKVWAAHEARAFAYAADKAPVIFERGTNRVLCRVSQDSGDWKFQRMEPTRAKVVGSLSLENGGPRAAHPERCA